eukprot:14495773-Heterocapsa_arctica.AAC.1
MLTKCYNPLEQHGWISDCAFQGFNMQQWEPITHIVQDKLLLHMVHELLEDIVRYASKAVSKRQLKANFALVSE